MKCDMILIRYGEMTLKKDNYKTFYRAIVNNIKNKLSKFPNLRFSPQPYRFYIYLNGENQDEVLESLSEVSGIYSYSLCVKTKKNIEDIAKVGAEIVNEYVREKHLSTYTFKVDTARSDKMFPMTSIEISKSVASLVLPQLEGVKVDVQNPDVTLNIDFRVDGVFVFTNEIKGIGGYPSEVGGKGMVMMSGGLDSPVAAFLSLKKGVKLSAIHFFSPPYTSYSSLQKVIDLLKVISKYSASGEVELYIVPFTDIQDDIHNNSDNTYMVTLMRRAMYKIASIVAMQNDISVIINGESIGQVASQTLESMNVVNEVTNIPIIRPLAIFDKEDIVSISKKIKTYDISIRPYEDCCTVFVPKHPSIKPKLSDVLLEEEKTHVNDLIQDAVSNIKKVIINSNSNINAFDLDESDKYDI